MYESVEAAAFVLQQLELEAEAISQLIAIILACPCAESPSARLQARAYHRGAGNTGNHKTGAHYQGCRVLPETDRL